MEKRYCRKCLTADMQKDAYFDSLHAYIKNLDPEIKAEEGVYQQRLFICKECDMLIDAMCRACGCFVEMRGAIRKNGCPYEKW